MRIASPFSCASFDATVTAPGDDGGDGLFHRGRVGGEVARSVECDDRCESRGNRVGADDADVLFGEIGRLLGGEDHVRVVRQHDDRLRIRALDRGDELGRRRVHRLPALDDLRAPGVLSKSERLPAPATTATTSRGERRCVGNGVQQALLAPLGLLVHVRDLDLLERPDSGRERERSTGLVRVHVHLHGRRIAYHEERIPERLELLLQRGAVEPAALDDEDGAVAVARELLVNRFEIQRSLDRGVRYRLARDDSRDAADDLEQARAACVDDACRPEYVEQLGSALDRVRASENDGGNQLARRSAGMPLGLLRHLADDGQHRAFDRLRHRGVCRVARAAERTRERRASRARSASATASAKPRMIWERMTPELPRAPISAARVSSFASVARSGAVVAWSWSTAARTVSVRFVPVSPSGTG